MKQINAFKEAAACEMSSSTSFTALYLAHNQSHQHSQRYLVSRAYRA